MIVEDYNNVPKMIPAITSAMTFGCLILLNRTARMLQNEMMMPIDRLRVCVRKGSPHENGNSHDNKLTHFDYPQTQRLRGIVHRWVMSVEQTTLEPHHQINNDLRWCHRVTHRRRCSAL
jgi:hypothetical protein